MESVQSECVIEALLDYFVSPLLPRRVSTDASLTDHQQILMAKQMHAVVILYNYYHRKQYSNSKFLDFESFCKVSCMLKPGLTPYLRSIHNCNYKSENLSNKYMVTEKKVVDACNICISLYPSEENPTVEALPISKVAIFLVDIKKENCVLLYNYSVQGVWSLVENELACCDEKLLQTELNASENELEHLAFSTVEKDTGIRIDNLNILERHLAYSLSHEMTAARLYIMKFKGTLKKGISQASIEDVKTSMEGPVVQDGSTSSFVEYYNVLPYYDIISHWLSRQKNAQPVEGNKKVTLNTTKDLKVRIKYVAIEPKNDLQTCKSSKSNGAIETKNKSVDSDSMPSRSRSCNSESVLPGKKQEIKVDSVHFEKSMIDDTKLENKVSSSNIQLKKLSSEKIKLVDNDRQLQQQQRKLMPIKEENLANDDVSKHKSSKTDNDLENKAPNMCIVAEKPNFEKDNLSYNNILPKDQNSKFVNMQTNNFNKGIDESNGSKQLMNENDGLQAGIGVKKLNTESKIMIEANGTTAKNVTYPLSKSLGTKDIVRTVESLCSGQKSSQHGEGKIISNNDFGNRDHQFHCCQHVSGDRFAEKVKSAEDITKSKAEDTTLEKLQLVSVQPNSTHCAKLYQTLESKKNELLQASLHIFQNKLDEMQRQKHLLEDKIASCEMNFQMILNEDEINGTTVESIIRELTSNCLDLLPNDISSLPESSKNVKRRKLSEVALALRSYCQELDDICRRSCWILPRYIVIPSFKDHEINGLFKATVELHGEDFELRSEGDEKSSPGEARESAACRMLAKLRDC